MPTDLSQICINSDASIHQAIQAMEGVRLGIILVVDQERHLQGTITDGDVRRAILANISLDDPVTVLLESKSTTGSASPITVSSDASRATMLRTLQEHKILHLPLVDDQQRVVSLVIMAEFLPQTATSMQAMIMAGGQGERLRPLTEDLPKPMLPVGDRPLMENIIDRLKDAGIEHVNISVHHQSEKITDHFGDGSEFGIDISYVTEDQPLGTAGALGIMSPPKETLLVINGDILTQLDFLAMLDYHREHGADLTVAVQTYDFQVPYGVVECDGPTVKRMIEKPTIQNFVNAGIYLLEPSVYQLIPNGEKFDMTDLIQKLLDEERPVVAFPIHESWLDIGEHEDYLEAQSIVKETGRRK
jgi:dTDP-glucose pyrophosphorylase